MFRFLLIKELKGHPGHGSISFQTNVLKSGQFVLFPPVLLTYIHRDVRRPLDRDSSSNCQQCQHGEHMGQTSGYLYTSAYQLWKVYHRKFQSISSMLCNHRSFLYVFNEHSHREPLHRHVKMPSEQATMEQLSPLSVWMQESIKRHQQKSRPTVSLTIDIPPILASIQEMWSWRNDYHAYWNGPQYIKDSTGVIQWVRN